MPKKCGECVYAVLVYNGYSNWTVEGTEVYCSRKLNPQTPFDKWYGEDKKDLFAETCNPYQNGDPVSIDIDRDDWVKGDTPWKLYENGFVSSNQIEDLLGANKWN